MENKIIISKKDIINNLLNRENIDKTRHDIAIYLNLTGTYLKVNKRNKNLLKIDFKDKETTGTQCDPKRYLNKLFYPAILNDEDITIILSYLEVIEPERAKRALTDFLIDPHKPTAANGFIYGVRNNNKKLKDVYIISEV